jgi:hypothetical protein
LAPDGPAAGRTAARLKNRNRRRRLRRETERTKNRSKGLGILAVAARLLREKASGAATLAQYQPNSNWAGPLRMRENQSRTLLRENCSAGREKNQARTWSDPEPKINTKNGVPRFKTTRPRTKQPQIFQQRSNMILTPRRSPPSLPLFDFK